MLDADGNINTTKLEKELREALDADIKYRQTDNMKKRAIKVATNYEEFKSMVQCAHLKTLNRKEVESLKDVKRGWVREHSIANSENCANILREERVDELRKRDKSQKKLAKQNPATSLELERGWRMQHSTAEKQRYLRSIGRQAVCALLEKEGNAELFEEILLVIVADENSDDVDWLQSVSLMKNFGMLIMFIPRELRDRCVSALKKVHGDSDPVVVAFQAK